VFACTTITNTATDIVMVWLSRQHFGLCRRSYSKPSLVSSWVFDHQQTRGLRKAIDHLSMGSCAVCVSENLVVNSHATWCTMVVLCKLGSGWGI